MGEHVMVIGAGVIGLTGALRLLQSGYRVTILERGLAGGESTAAAAGILGAQSEMAVAGPLLSLALASRAMFPDLVRHLQEVSGIDVGYERSGVLEVALDPAEGQVTAGRAEWMLAQGLRVELLDRAEVLRLEPALNERIVGANYYPDDHWVEPERLARALMVAVVRLGGVVHQGVSVRGVLVTGSPRGVAVGVVTADGERWAADQVVVAAGAWSSRLEGGPPLRTRVKPLAGQIVQMERRPPGLRHVIYGLKGYVVPRTDGRVVLGSTLEDRGFDKAVTLAGVARVCAMGLELVPGLAESRWAGAWCGLRPATLDDRPLLGSGGVAGCHWATGHYRNGILLAPVTAEGILALVRGERLDEAWREFSPMAGSRRS